MRTHALSALTRSTQTKPDPPLRAELLGAEQLDALAERLAGGEATVGKSRPRSRVLLRKLQENAAVLRQARDSAAASAARVQPLMPDAEWLLDNFFVIEDALRAVRTDLPKGYADELPVVAQGRWAGLPRVYALAVELVSHTDSHLEDGTILRFVRSFQGVSPLSTGELWAVPIMLRLALLENLRRLAEHMLVCLRERDRATEWAREAVDRGAKLPPIPADASDAFLVGVQQAARDLGEEPLTPPDDLTDVLCREHLRQAANQVSIGNCVTSLRLLNAVDWREYFERASLVEEVLRAEPTGIYRLMDFATRDRYRRAVEQFAKAARRDEVGVARLALARAAGGTTPRERHVGLYLIDEGRDSFARELGCRFGVRIRVQHVLAAHPHVTYFGGIVLFTGAIVALAMWLALVAGMAVWGVVLAAVVAILPASEIAVGLVNHLVCRLIPPRTLPKMGFVSGIPAEFRTVVVIPGLLTSDESAAALCERLELHFLANPDPQLRFALLTDWADAPAETTVKDAALLAAAVAGIRKLNERHAGHKHGLFFLFHRRRQFNPSEGVWMGWERKRGKLDEFNRLLRGATDTSYTTGTGVAAALEARFVLTLDADTVLPRDAAWQLVATLAHPLNAPLLSNDGRRVVAGYGVLQPRVSFLYKSGLRSRFARTFAGSAGIDPYSSATSDVYQDLFGQGTFTGKGLYDVDAFHATAGRAFPDNRILSHDLIESTFARCGLVTDIEVFDDFPATYNAHARRDHRWVRGDWQLLPWLGRTVPTPEGRRRNAVAALGRWKVFDNLRRSLIAPALIAMLTVGWTVLPGSGWAWSFAAVAVLAMPLILHLWDQFVAMLFGGGRRAALRGARRDLPATLGQVGLAGVFLANQAVIAVDAIARTLWRMAISRRLLEWETAAATEARLGTGLRQFIRSMGLAVAVAVALAGLIAWAHPAALPVATPWLAAWLLSPVVAWWVSRPLGTKEVPLTDPERRELRRMARKTWRFFEAFVTAEDHWLPPDNYQEEPKGVVAHRTSPTNVGLLLLSNLSAHDLGAITAIGLAERMTRTFDTLDKLERYRGHFLNWYETHTLRPLPPAYVSTVDSGNLLGCLLATATGLRTKVDEPVPSDAAGAGLLDTLNLAAESLPAGATDVLRTHLSAAPADDLLAWADWLERTPALIPSADGESGAWVKEFEEQVQRLRAELVAVCPWLPSLRELPPEVRTAPPYSELNRPFGIRHMVERLPTIRAALADRPEGSSVAEALDRSVAAALVRELDSLAVRAERFADAMDFRFLYNEARHLFSIGYNVPLERLDSAHYDLLASEAALTSYLAVARGVVPREHWFQLGRIATEAAGYRGLISWGGTMFEYLMPRLLLAPPPGTMLDVAQRGAVARQIQYGRQTRVPWGISESGFAVLSAEGDYQYQSFGVPGLGLKRGLGKDLVVAPYATLLATMTDAAAAVRNFAPLRAVGGEGPFGFYEAIDFTPERADRGGRCQVVKSYMAHHQGMGLCALANRLLGDIHCRRLTTIPAVRAVELLLQERVPLDAPEVRLTEADSEAALPADVTAEVSRRLTTADTPSPRTHFLSNGHYTVMLTNAGGGFSTCRGLAVTRWRTDATRDSDGSFVYIRHPATDRVWSVGHQPVAAPADSYEVVFSADKAEFRRRDGQIETLMEVAVAPDQDAEVRRVTLINHDTRPHSLEVTSFAEVVLGDPRADLAHPAFGKLFLETEWLPAYDALLCRRRPRSMDQSPVFAVHLVSAGEGVERPTEHESDRAKFLGRRRTPAGPEALGRRLSGTVGPVLDPVFALRKTVRIAPGSSATLSFVTGVASTREAAEALAGHFHASTAAARTFDLAWARSRVELRDLGVTAAESHLFQRLAGHVLYPPPGLRALRCLQDNRQGQSGLWRFGISGDRPILAVCISDGNGVPLARQAIKAHAFWRGRGFPIDLLLLADRPASYREGLYEELSAAARAGDSRDLIDKPGGVFVRKAEPGSEDRTLLLASAQVVLYGDRGTLGDQTDTVGRGRRMPPGLVPTRPARQDLPDPPAIEGLVFFNGTGGFTADGREYAVTRTPPAPWVNVIANPTVGCLASDSGAGSTWAGNSQTNRLTPWNNDPVGDAPAEAVYLRDDETGHFWTPTPLPAGCPAAVRHGAGYTSYTVERDGLSVELMVFVAALEPVKLLRLRVVNRGRSRRLSAWFCASWVLGTTREQTAPHVVTELDAASGTLLARCAFAGDYGDAVAFADTSLRPRTVSGDRFEFIGRNRSGANPAALQRESLSGHVGAGLDPCAALAGRFDLPAGVTTKVVFLLGQAADATSATALAAKYRDPATADIALREVTAAWEARLSTIRVRTPDAELDVLVNRWLLYQVLSCRMWGRTALYQSGGAFGFRDQLQDAMALLYAEPGEARAHILRAASRQFAEGDVQHWWHPPTGRGVRTRFSDDFLWLPYAVARYVAVTGDAGILDEGVPFLRGHALRPDEQEEYFQPDVSDETASLYEHCLRALAHGWRLGPHGLPLMGCGDWNDGMNLVGAGGTGESVWVAWFQVVVRTDFAAVAEGRGDRPTADRLRAEAVQLRSAVEAAAWDGDWYLRAWFDDGTPLGSHVNDECRIDSLPQSWAVFAGGDDKRACRGMDAVLEHLVFKDDKLIKLFEPPFDAGRLQPGYIKGYVPGIRENGGQYTHAAIWVVQALASLGRGGEAHALWKLLNPLSHADSQEGVARYKVEPYVVAADVYGMPPHVGRGGWTWYTGSAAWMYRAAVETILGLTKRGDRLSFDPRIPAAWTGYEVDYRFGSALYRCQIENPHGVESGVAEVWLDCARMPGGVIPLRDDAQEHAVRVVLGASVV